MSGLPLIVIAGPTASGKSALALTLAEKFRARGQPAEILCADSVTVYRGLEIGAAKPTAAERASVPHHLLDLADPRAPFTAADFVAHAAPLIEALRGRGTIPILAGGTGFYLRALLRGMATSGPEDPAHAARVKTALLERAGREGYAALHAELLRLDPGSARTVHPNDHYRIVRALQAMQLHGALWSELNERARAADFRFSPVRYFALELTRERLAERVHLRTRLMLEAGLLAEVQGLLTAGVPANAKPLQSVGYRECVHTLEGREPERTLAERIERATLQLAKQQRTFLRGERGVEWLEEPHEPALYAALGLHT